MGRGATASFLIARWRRNQRGKGRLLLPILCVRECAGNESECMCACMCAWRGVSVCALGSACISASVHALVHAACCLLEQREMAMGRGGSPGSDLLARRKLVKGGSEVLKPEQKAEC